MLAFLQRLKENLALFQRMQLVCEGHLRSFTSNTYVRLRATLTFVYGQHLHTLVRETKIRDPLCPTDISPVEGETMRGVRIEFDSVTCIYHLAKRCAPLEVSDVCHADS